MKKAAITLLLCGGSLFAFWFFYIQAPRKLPAHYSMRVPQSEPGEANAPLRRIGGTSPGELARSANTTGQSPLMVPAAFADLLKEPWRPLSLAQLASIPPLSPALERDLIERCRVVSNLTNAAGLFSVLTYHGADAAIEFLAETLTNRFRGKRLDQKEEWLLLHLPSDIGLLARRNDRAFVFLRQGLNLEFWRENLGWLSDDADRSIRILVAMTLRGIGTSGRPEAGGILSEERKPGSNTMRLGLQGALMDAAFWHWLALNEGERFYRGEVSGTGEQVMSRFSAWRERTSEGQEWARWFAAAELQRPRSVLR